MRVTVGPRQIDSSHVTMATHNYSDFRLVDILPLGYFVADLATFTTNIQSTNANLTSTSKYFSSLREFIDS